MKHLLKKYIAMAITARNVHLENQRLKAQNEALRSRMDILNGMLAKECALVEELKQCFIEQNQDLRKMQ